MAASEAGPHCMGPEENEDSWGGQADAGEVLVYLYVFVSIYFAASCINKILMQGKKDFKEEGRDHPYLTQLLNSFWYQLSITVPQEPHC